MSPKFFWAIAYEVLLLAFIFLRVHEKVLLHSAGVQKEPNQAQNTGVTFGKEAGVQQSWLW